MQYAVVIPNTKSKSKIKSNELDKIYDTPEQAEKRMKKVSNSKIIEIPEIKAGLILYKSDVYYKTIIKETKTYWDLNDTNNLEPMNIPVKRDNLVKYFINEMLDGGKEEYDKEYINNVYVDNGIDEIENMLVGKMKKMAKDNQQKNEDYDENNKTVKKANDDEDNED